MGLATQTINLDIGGPGAPGGLTNYDSPSALGTSQIDGTPFGSLASVDVDDDGFVTAIFTNGLTRRIYQIPLATFGNVDGLIPEHGGVYRLGPGAGALSMRGAGIAGAGGIKARALESSTVDLAEEFSNLIMTQRAYSASSKIITTADEMLDELIRLKR
jgi:flagellar hook protein FlgE